MGAAVLLQCLQTQTRPVGIMQAQIGLQTTHTHTVRIVAWRQHTLGDAERRPARRERIAGAARGSPELESPCVPRADLRNTRASSSARSLVARSAQELQHVRGHRTTVCPGGQALKRARLCCDCFGWPLTSCLVHVAQLHMRLPLKCILQPTCQVAQRALSGTEAVRQRSTCRAQSAASSKCLDLGTVHAMPCASTITIWRCVVTHLVAHFLRIPALPLQFAAGCGLRAAAATILRPVLIRRCAPLAGRPLCRAPSL